MTGPLVNGAIRLTVPRCRSQPMRCLFCRERDHANTNQSKSHSTPLPGTRYRVILDFYASCPGRHRPLFSIQASATASYFSLLVANYKNSTYCIPLFTKIYILLTSVAFKISRITISPSTFFSPSTHLPIQKHRSFDVGVVENEP